VVAVVVRMWSKLVCVLSKMVGLVSAASVWKRQEGLRDGGVSLFETLQCFSVVFSSKDGMVVRRKKRGEREWEGENVRKGACSRLKTDSPTRFWGPWGGHWQAGGGAAFVWPLTSPVTTKTLPASKSEKVLP
jgi:hypothetical protein